MKKNKKRNRIFLLLILLLGISIGFAALATTLKINGNASITKNNWNIYWDNIANKSGVTPTTEPVISADENNVPKTLVTWGVTLDKPGDYYEFTVDIVNAGSIDAMITAITQTLNGQPITEENKLPDYIKYSVAYLDGYVIGENQILPKESSETLKIRIEYSRSVTNTQVNNQEDALTYTLSYGLKFGQADENAIEVRFPCPGPDCVYAYYTESKNYGDNASTLTGYTSDYTELLDGDSQQRKVFLGHILDENGKIERGFACGIKDNKVYCVEGTTDGSKYSKNKELTNILFPDINDPINNYFEMTCMSTQRYSIGSSKIKGNECPYEDVGYCKIEDDGTAKITYDGKTCSVKTNGKMNCN